MASSECQRQRNVDSPTRAPSPGGRRASAGRQEAQHGQFLHGASAQLEALHADSKKVGTQGQEIDFALLVDGLAAEREQGITIDVAYRYFSTPRRKFIIADTPGHVQYTRNMVTGASTADLALILIDARQGVVEQSRRHAFISSLLGIRHVVVCVNKMDLVDYDEAVFIRLRDEFRDFAAKLDVDDLTFIPISALEGDNVVSHAANASFVFAVKSSPGLTTGYFHPSFSVRPSCPNTSSAFGGLPELRSCFQLPAAISRSTSETSISSNSAA